MVLLSRVYYTLAVIYLKLLRGVSLHAAHLCMLLTKIALCQDKI